jgi:flagellar assembly factor FliW
MPRVHTEQFGELDYAEEAVVVFPRGLPGFEQARRFVLLDDAEFVPLAHLQNLETGDLCFLALPVRSIDPEYETMLGAEDREALGWRDAGQPTHDLALLSAGRDGSLSANLLAPVVIDLATRRGVQAVRCDTRYSHRHALCAEPVCS